MSAPQAERAVLPSSGELTSFRRLPMGALFRFPEMLGSVLLRLAVYTKAGANSYGLAASEPMWRAEDDDVVEVV